MTMTKLWLEQSSKFRKLDYIQTKNRITNGIAEYDTIFDDFYHPTLSVDGFFLSKKHRWFYNFDAECVSSVILRSAHRYADQCANKEINLPSFEEMYDTRPSLFNGIHIELKPEWEDVLDGFNQLVNRYKLEFIKQTDFDLVSATMVDFNYSYGVGLHLILPCNHLDSEDQINGYIQEFLTTEQSRTVVLGKYPKDWLVDYVEQQNQR